MIKNYALTFILVFYSTTFFAKNNIAFIENKGQIIDQNNLANYSVKYIACNNEMKLQLKENSFSYELIRSKKYKKNNTAISTVLERNIIYHSERDNWLKRINDSFVILSHRIDVVLIGATKHPEIKPEVQSEDYINYYTTCTPEAGVTYVHQYQKVTYQNIYPNIDLEFVLDAANKQTFKYNFIVHPGGKVSDIQLQYKGANSTELTASGNLNIATAYGNVEENIPRSYVTETGKEIKVNYMKAGQDVYSFYAGVYNKQQTLVIDPWCTYFGWDGNLGTCCTSSLVADNSNNIFIVGTTNIMTNIASSGVYQTSYGGGASDAFIRKFSPSGNPIWCTYYGGNSNDEAVGIDYDEFSNVYITGPTWSSNNIATSGSFLSSLPVTTWTSFLSKFNSNGVRQWGTYYPANSYRITKDHSNNIIIGGYAEDTDAVTLGAHQTIPGGNGDDFIAKFTSSGNRLWGTFYGGIESENFTIDLDIDAQDNIFLTGTTSSTTNISTIGSFQQNFGGISDNFIVKFNPNCVRQWGTYYGGLDIEERTTYVSTNQNGDVYFTGEAESIGVFASSGAFQATNSGGLDYCLAKFNNNGQRIWSTYFGGTDNDQVLSLKIDKSGNPIFSGYTFSTNVIATPNSYQQNFNGMGDDFIEKFNPTGTRQWGTYFGGTKVEGNENGAFLTIDNKNNIIITGGTNSLGLATINAYCTNLIDTVNGDIFLASLDSNGTFTTGIGVVKPTTSLMKVYPNPAKDKITVSIKEYAGKRGSLLLTDIEGKVVKSVVVKSAECSLDVKDLSAGVYLLQYEDGEVCETVKFIKE